MQPIPSSTPPKADVAPQFTPAALLRPVFGRQRLFDADGTQRFVPLRPASTATGILRFDEFIDLVHQGLDVAAAARRMHVPLYKLSHFVELLTGVNGKTFVEQYRVELAAVLLRYTSQSIEAIARRCGYAQRVGLDRCFLRYRQLSPSDYRNQSRQAGDEDRYAP
ncbi:MAG: AraC family transcriptional regulator [Prevotellaceae bacterium]|jgi:AraC-like DNA-binding protein|nr:AraC family transcriptional regulator [Prevotellaceae bacterium]